MMAGVHRDIRQYFKHSISRTEEKEIPQTGATTTEQPAETHKAGKQSEYNESTIRSIDSNKNGISKPKHNPVHLRTPTPERTKTVRHFTKSTNIINLSKYKLNKDEEKLLNKGLNFIPTAVREHPSHILHDYLLFD